MAEKWRSPIWQVEDARASPAAEGRPESLSRELPLDNLWRRKPQPYRLWSATQQMASERGSPSGNPVWVGLPTGAPKERLQDPHTGPRLDAYYTDSILTGSLWQKASQSHEMLVNRVAVSSHPFAGRRSGEGAAVLRQLFSVEPGRPPQCCF